LKGEEIETELIDPEFDTLKQSSPPSKKHKDACFTTK